MGAVSAVHVTSQVGNEELFFPVELGGPENTDEIVRSLSIPNRLITQRSFPLHSRPVIEVATIEIVLPPKNFDRKDAAVLLAERGLEPPMHEHPIRFAWQYKDRFARTLPPFLASGHRIVFPHEPHQHHGDVMVIVFAYEAKGSALWLYHAGGVNQQCVIAGVRPSNSSPK